MIPRPALMIPWRNTIASPLTTIVAFTFDGTPEIVDTESIPLPLTLGRDYWVSADAAADADPDGEGGSGDLVALLATALVAEVATIDAVEPSWTTDGRLRLTATLSGAAVQWGILTVHEDDEPAWTMARLLGLPIIPDAAPQAISAGGVLTMPVMSDRLFWPGRPFHRDSRDRDEFVGSVSHTTDGFAWPAVQTAPVVRREVGWDYLRLQHVLEEYADELGPFNTAETIRREGLRWGRRVRLYDDIGDLGTADAYSVYRPREPLQPIVRQGEGDDQIFHDLRLDLVRLSAASAEGDGGGDPPTINNYTVGGAEESLSVRAGDEVVIAYSITGADSVSINQGIGAVDPESDTITGVYAPEGVTEYTITATNPYGTSERTVTITGVRQVLTRLGAAFRSMWGSDLSGASWPYREAGFDTPIARGSNASGGQSTSGFAALALPAALVNQGVRPADPSSSSTQGYSDSSTAGDGNQHPAACWRVLLLIEPKVLTNSRILWQMFRDGNNLVSVSWLSSGSTLRVGTVRGGTTTNYDITGHGLENDSPAILEFVFDEAGGDAGEARFICRCNGVEVLNTPSGGTGSFAGFSDTQTLFGLMGSRTGAVTLDAVYTAWEVRPGSAHTDWTLPAHQLDAQALGLYTPP